MESFCLYSVVKKIDILGIALFMQLIYRPDNGEILGVHIFGLHAADLIHEASNAIALGTRIQVINCPQAAVLIHVPSFVEFSLE